MIKMILKWRVVLKIKRKQQIYLKNYQQSVSESILWLIIAYLKLLAGRLLHKKTSI